MLAAECSERARSPIEATEGRSPLPIGSRCRHAPQVVVTAASAGADSGTIFSSPLGLWRDQRLLADRRLGEDDPLAVDALCAQIFEHEREPAQVLGPHRRGRGRVCR